MKLLEEKSIKIGDKEYPMKMSMRAMIEYEKLSGKTINEITTIEDITFLFYSTIKMGGAKFTYDEFLDLIDDKPESLTAFTDAMIVESEKKRIVR